MSNPNSLPGYDSWKLASPDDEDTVRRCRSQYDREPREPQSQVINGQRIYEEDFIYDPLGNY